MMNFNGEILYKKESLYMRLSFFLFYIFSHIKFEIISIRGGTEMKLLKNAKSISKICNDFEQKCAEFVERQDFQHLKKYLDSTAERKKAYESDVLTEKAKIHYLEVREKRRFLTLYQKYCDIVTDNELASFEPLLMSRIPTQFPLCIAGIVFRDFGELALRFPRLNTICRAE